MESADVSAMVADLSEWTERTRREPAVDLAEAANVLCLLSDELEVPDLGELRDGDLETLLLGVYPQVLAEEGEELEDPSTVVPTVHALLDFARDSHRIGEDAHASLSEELDAVEPLFLDALSGEGELDLKEAYGLPDRIGPIRLPPDSQLAAAARQCRTLERVRQLALRFASGADNDAAAMALALGVGEHELAALSALAEELAFLDVGDAGAVIAGPGLQEWPDGSDGEVLAVWRQAFNSTLAWSLLTDAEHAGESDLDFSGAGAWFVPLFLARHRGLPVPAVSEMIEELAGEELPEPRARQAWETWVAAHGDPADALLGRLAELGAVELDGEVVRATPLAAHAIRAELVESGVDVPLLPPVEEMTAADLIELGRDGLDGELEAEANAWFAARGPEAAADELLTVAAAGGPAERIIATRLVREELGAAAEAQWRGALDVPVLRRHAKLALAMLLGPAPEFENTDEDLGWLLVDSIAGSASGVPEEELPALLAAVFQPAGPDVVERLWRLDHPATHEVLTMLGTYHPDKGVAKAARKGAFRAADRATS